MEHKLIEIGINVTDTETGIKVETISEPIGNLSGLVGEDASSKIGVLLQQVVELIGKNLMNQYDEYAEKEGLNDE